MTRRPGSAKDPLWYKDALIYQVHVRTFFDSNSDGIGDFPGLTAKLDYIQRLGVSCIWLLPFYPSPLKDDGYDIAHYEEVNPRYGTLRDFKTFLREAHERGLQVITELVINHTSDQHAWFQAARKAPADSGKRSYYVWSDTPDRYNGVRIIFQDTEHSNWAWDNEAKAYYWHRFFSHQPDLNFDNPRVVRAVVKVMKFWMDMGIDGLRLDAVPYLIERDGTICENLPETHDILREIRKELDLRYENRMLLAEANQWPADVRPYFGDGDECHMAFHFPLMPRLFMALRQEDRHPITEVLRQTPDLPEACQWATFLRNHDELTLEMVTNEERDYMWQQYAADPQMRLNQGIRRRLAPLMENNRQRIELLNSLLFSLPGTPVIYYGDEIGMGDNVYLGDRNGVRTPMQWTGDRNAGFSTADPSRLYAPPVSDPVYNFQGLNVEAQERTPFSLLNWMKRLIAIRQQHKVFGRGTIEFLGPANRRVLAFIRRYENETILCVANLSRGVQPVEIDLSRYAGRVPIEMIDRTEFPRIGTLPYMLTLGPYGFYWFQLLESTAIPTVTRVAPRPAAGTASDLPPLLVGPVWDQLFDSHTRVLLERDYLRPWLVHQRWYTSTATGCGNEKIRIEDWIILRRGSDPHFLVTLHVTCDDGSEQRYAVPLALASGALAEAIAKDSPHRMVANITGARRGVLYEALTDESAFRLLAAIGDRQTITTKRATIAGEPRPFLTSTQVPTAAPVARPLDPHNAVVLIGEKIALKVMRKLDPLPQPEVAVPAHVTGPGGYGRVPRVAGTLTYQPSGGEPLLLAAAHEYLWHQRNAWDHAVEEAQRFFDRVIARGQDAPSLRDVHFGSFLTPSSDLGVETFEAASEANTLVRRTSPLATAGGDLDATLAGAGAGAATPGSSAADTGARGGERGAERRRVPAEARDTIGGYLETANMLGKRVAELHLALARPEDDPVFGVQQADPRAWQMAAEEVAHQARLTLSVFRSRVEQLPPKLAEEAWVVMQNEEALITRLAALADKAGTAPSHIRIHGDLHLGQILLQQADALIIDFEGDPARPLAQRRTRQSPMRDLAGMVESFSYAANAALFGYTATRPGDFDRLQPWARYWPAWTSVVFLRSYRASVGAAPFAPSTIESFEAGLRLFLAEQALRDLENELRYRPEWLSVPLRMLIFVLTPPAV
jgi:maltose alpha-D-glucosyltransferase/alpha-amylase